MNIPEQAVQLSIVQRLHRFLENPCFHVRTWYEPVACQLLEETGRVVGAIRLVMDTTKCGVDHQWLTVSLAFRRRTIPVAWTWLPGARGHSSAIVQLALLKYVHTLVPSNVPVFLVADTEFEDGGVQKQVHMWSWFYVLRQKPNNSVKIAGEWQPLCSLVRKPGHSVWWASVPLTQKHQLTTNLLAYWKPGEEHPWLLATNLPSQHETLKAYKRRMWIDEMHGDLKAHGFFLVDSHWSAFTRLSRLTFAVVLLYLWIVLQGAKVIKHGQRRLVDRNDRRDLSVFQIGLRSIERRLASALPPSFPLDIKLSGG